MYEIHSASKYQNSCFLLIWSGRSVWQHGGFYADVDPEIQITSDPKKYIYTHRICNSMKIIDLLNAE